MLDELDGNSSVLEKALHKQRDGLGLFLPYLQILGDGVGEGLTGAENYIFVLGEGGLDQNGHHFLNLAHWDVLN